MKWLAHKRGRAAIRALAARTAGKGGAPGANGARGAPIPGPALGRAWGGGARELPDIAALTESREIMEYRSPRFMVFFIYVVAALLVTAVLWAALGQMDEYARAEGEVRPAQAVSTVRLGAGGRVAAIAAYEGKLVQAGETLLELDEGSLKEQRAQALGRQAAGRQDLQSLRTLRDSVATGENLLKNEGAQQPYYHLYMQYASNLEAALSDVEAQNRAADRNRLDAGFSLRDNAQSLEQLQSDIAGYTRLLEAVRANLAYAAGEDGPLLQALYEDYRVRYRKKLEIYEGKAGEYDRLRRLHEGEAPGGAGGWDFSFTIGESGTATAQEVAAAREAMELAQREAQEVRSGFILDISSRVSELRRQALTKGLGGDSLAARLFSFGGDFDSGEVTKDKLHYDMLVSVDGAIRELEEEQEALSERLATLEDALRDARVVASTAGVVTFMQEISEGDTVEAGSSVLKIVPLNSQIRVRLRVADSDIAAIRPGQQVHCQIRSIPSSEFGEAVGEVALISPDSVRDPQTGVSYFYVEAQLRQAELRNRRGETRQIKPGMSADARIISGSRSVLSWLLEKLHFMG